MHKMIKLFLKNKKFFKIKKPKMWNKLFLKNKKFSALYLL